MAAIIKLRRGTNANKSNITLQQSELFYNTDLHTLQVGTSGSNIDDYVTVVKLDSLNSGSLNINGSITASNITVQNDITIGGNIFLGDSIADNIVITGEFSSSLVPNDNNQFDLGSVSQQWRHLYSQNATIDNINLPGSNIVSSSQQISNYNTFLEIDGDSVFSQSIQIDHDSTTNFVTNEHINHTAVDIIAGLGISGGGDISLSRTITLDTGSNHFGSGVINALTGSDIVSSSQQVADYNRFLEFNGDDVVSSSQQVADYNRFLEFDGDNVVSSSQQIQNYNTFLEFNGDNVVSSSQQIQNYNTFLEFNGDDVVSSSQQIADYTRFLEFNGDNVVSSSQQVIDHLHSSDIVSSSQQIQNYNTFLEFNGDDVVSSSQQIADYTRFLEFNGDNVLSSSNENFTSYSQSVDTRLDTLEGPFSTSVDSRLDNEEASGSNHRDRIVLLESTGSDHETRLDTLELTFSSSVDTRLDDLESTGSDHESRIDVIEGSFSSSVDSRLDSIQTYTSSLKTAVDVNGQNLTVYGDLTVQGTQTSLNTNDLIIQDKLIAVASGSTTSAQADGAGLFISGADKSITWDDTNSNILLDGNVSSSVGFEGDGSELTDIQYSNIQFNGSQIVSRSAQIVLDDADKTGFNTADVSENSTNLYYTDARVKAKLNTETVISGSEQVNANTITNFDSNVKDKLNTEGVFSGSEQVNANTITNFDSNVLSYIDSQNVHSSSFLGTATTSNLSEGTNLYYTDIRVKTKLNTETVISGSEQVNANTITNFDSNVKDKLNTDGVISGSEQLESDYDSRYLEIDGDNVVSSSQQISNYNTFLEINSDNVVSSSQQISNYNTFLEINGDNVFSQSAQVNINSTTGNLTSLGTVTTGNILALLPDGTLSGSNQVNADTILNFDSNVKTKLNTETVISGSSFETNEQGTFTASINDVDTEIDLGLDVSDSPSFQGLTLTNLSSLGAGNVNALISGSSGTIGYRSLGTAGFLNVSASVGDDANSIPTNQAVNNALIAAGAGDLTEFNPTNTFNPNTTGLIHLSTGTQIGGVRGVQGNIHVAIDTGSTHFNNGVLENLPSNLVSQSEQIDLENVVGDTDDVSEGSSNLYFTDARVKTKLNADTVISSSAQISALGYSTTDNELTQEEVEDFAGALVATGGTKTGITVTYDDANGNMDFVVATQSDENFTNALKNKLDNIESTADVTDSGNVTPILNTLGVISGSTQILDGSNVLSSSNENFTSYSQSVDTRLDTLEEESHENPLTFSDTSTIALSRVTNTITADAIGGIVSGSSQITDGSGIVSQSLLNDLTNGEVNQLKNINSETITNTQWGYVGSMNQSVSTTNNVQFNNLTVAGNLTVDGTETILNTNQLVVQDKLISVASGSTTSAQADGAGLHISGADESITWDNGNSRFNISDDTHIVGSLTSTADVVAYASSDERLKNNITKISGPLEKINAINGYTFDWDEEKQNIYKGRDYGVIAQEIERVAPELVNTRDNGYKAVKYEKIVPILIESIKELQKQIDELKKSK